MPAILPIYSTVQKFGVCKIFSKFFFFLKNYLMLMHHSSIYLINTVKKNNVKYYLHLK